MCPTGIPLATKQADLRSAFNVMDVDHDGKISHNDLKLFYADYAVNDNDDIIGTMMKEADLNEDGYVEYEEFEKMLFFRRSSNVMEEVFNEIDKDGDGKLGFSDLRSYLGLAGINVNDDDDIKAMLLLANGNENDGVTFEGFLKILAI
ncbi:EF-hand domain pair [Artemisia annua]|uniref:EF-hand domain pair n=1 Tax=Artemisia annua TaxID=35608 RepID=A0A2U1NEQ8_ARTAN|nr:EF-hand domain pair [Artemisia annua]